VGNEGFNDMLKQQLDRIEKRLASLPCTEHGENIVRLQTQEDSRNRSSLKRLSIFGIVIASIFTVFSKLFDYFLGK
jgi:hypothetical protein